MDYSEDITIVGEPELAYARWYSGLPAARKAQMLCDLFQFGVDSIRYNAKKQNPYLTESETMLFYFEKNLKNSFSPKVFEFIRIEMMKRAEIEWENRFKAMKKQMGWSYDEIARFIQAESGNSVKSSVNRKLPAMAKLAVCVFEAMKDKGV
jgi:Tfp pilus assembly protein PilO